MRSLSQRQQKLRRSDSWFNKFYLGIFKFDEVVLITSCTACSSKADRPFQLILFSRFSPPSWRVGKVAQFVWEELNAKI